MGFRGCFEEKKKNFLENVWRNEKSCIFAAANEGALAQLARALAWHARGHRFDSVMLHNPAQSAGFFLSRKGSVMSNVIIIVSAYLLLINIIAFVLYGIDRKQARRRSTRILSSILLWMTRLGGGLGKLVCHIRFPAQETPLRFQETRSHLDHDSAVRFRHCGHRLQRQPRKRNQGHGQFLVPI